MTHSVQESIGRSQYTRTVKESNVVGNKSWRQGIPLTHSKTNYRRCCLWYIVYVGPSKVVGKVLSIAGNDAKNLLRAVKFTDAYIH